MVKGYAAGSGARRGDTPRIRRSTEQKVFPGPGGNPKKVGGEIRPLRLRVEPFGSCRINGNGYPRINSGKYRNVYLHRAVWERLAKKKVPKGFTVHHMNGKLCWCPDQLVALGPGLHVHQPIRDPYTGEFLSRDSYVRRYGLVD